MLKLCAASVKRPVCFPISLCLKRGRSIWYGSCTTNAHSFLLAQSAKLRSIYASNLVVDLSLIVGASAGAGWGDIRMQAHG